MVSSERFAAVLKNHSMKATPQRIAVHEAMLELGHASADEVASYIRTKMGGDITTVSVYNILSKLSEMGIYNRCLSMDSRMYFDANTEKHVNLYDTVRHEYRDIDDAAIVALVENHFKGRRFRGYSVDGVRINLLCHPTQRAGRQKKLK